jgi:hypothetical protein
MTPSVAANSLPKRETGSAHFEPLKHGIAIILNILSHFGPPSKRLLVLA